MTPFGISGPGRILFGRGEAAKAVGLITGYGLRGVVVHGAQAARAAWLVDGLRGAGADVRALACPGEPTLAMLDDALSAVRGMARSGLWAWAAGRRLTLARRLRGLRRGPPRPWTIWKLSGAVCR